MTKSVHDTAVSFAKRAAGSAIIGQTFTDILAAGEEVAKGPLVMYLQLSTLYGGDMSFFPKVGSEGGNNPDLYPDPDSKTGKRKLSFFNDFFASLPVGASIKDAQEACRKAKAKEEGADEELVALSSADMESKTKRLAKLYTNGVTLLRRSVLLSQLLEDIKEMGTVDLGNGKVVPKINVSFVMQKDKNSDAMVLSDTTVPVKIIDYSDFPKNIEKYKVISVGAFLNLSVAKAVAKDGGTWSSLVNSSRTTKTDKKEEALSYKTFQPAALAVANYVDNKANWTALAKMMAGEANDDLVITIGDLNEALTGLMGPHEARYMHLKAAQDEPAKSAKKAA